VERTPDEVPLTVRPNVSLQLTDAWIDEVVVAAALVRLVSRVQLPSN
jgi:hypothetical protein